MSAVIISCQSEKFVRNSCYRLRFGPQFTWGFYYFVRHSQAPDNVHLSRQVAGRDEYNIGLHILYSKHRVLLLILNTGRRITDGILCQTPRDCVTAGIWIRTHFPLAGGEKM